MKLLEQVEYFLNVIGDGLVKNSAIQLNCIKAIKLNYFNVLNVEVIP